MIETRQRGRVNDLTRGKLQKVASYGVVRNVRIGLGFDFRGVGVEPGLYFALAAYLLPSWDDPCGEGFLWGSGAGGAAAGSV